MNDKRIKLIAGAAAALMLMTIAGQNTPVMAQLDKRVYMPLTLKDAPPPPNIFGLHIDIGLSTGQALRGFGSFDAAKSTWARLQPGLRWGLVEPTEGARNWGAVAELDSQLTYLAQRRIKTFLVINYAPQWARVVSDAACGPVLESKFPAMRAFIRDAVTRYSAPPFNVTHFEFWNEPDAPIGVKNSTQLFGCWGLDGAPGLNGAGYGRALKVAYEAAKAANPAAQMWVGGLLADADPRRTHGTEGYNQSAGFFDAMLSTAGGSFDGVSFHAYDYITDASLGHYTANNGWSGSKWDTDGPILIQKAAAYRQLMQARGITGKQLANTEVSLVRFQDPGATFAAAVWEKTKAGYIPASYAAGIHEGLTANIWFELFGWQGGGLVDSSGNPLQGFTAHKLATELIGGSVSEGKIAQADVGVGNVSGYKLVRGSQRVWVVWSKQDGERTLTLPRTPSKVLDPLGNPLSTSSVKVSPWPIYIVW
jgi:hypothetical protein